MIIARLELGNAAEWFSSFVSVVTICLLFGTYVFEKRKYANLVKPVFEFSTINTNNISLTNDVLRPTYEISFINKGGKAILRGSRNFNNEDVFRDYGKGVVREGEIHKIYYIRDSPPEFIDINFSFTAIDGTEYSQRVHGSIDNVISDAPKTVKEFFWKVRRPL